MYSRKRRKKGVYAERKKKVRPLGQPEGQKKKLENCSSPATFAIRWNI